MRHHMSVMVANAAPTITAVTIMPTMERIHATNARTHPVENTDLSIHNVSSTATTAPSAATLGSTMATTALTMGTIIKIAIAEINAFPNEASSIAASFAPTHMKNASMTKKSINAATIATMLVKTNPNIS